MSQNTIFMTLKYREDSVPVKVQQRVFKTSLVGNSLKIAFFLQVRENNCGQLEYNMYARLYYLIFIATRGKNKNLVRCHFNTRNEH